MTPLHSPTVRTVLPAFLAALAYVSSWHPIKANVLEFKNFIVCLAGIVLGPARGAVTGALTGGLQGVFDPLGPAGPVMTLFLVLGFSLTGVMGGLVGSGRSGPFRAGTLGALCTIQFDIMTSLPIALVHSLPVLPVVAGTFLFSPWHVPVNALMFAALMPTVHDTLARAGWLPVLPSPPGPSMAPPGGRG